MDFTSSIAALRSGQLHRFMDWPVSAVPKHGAGVYTVWDKDGGFLYVGMAGRFLDEQSVSKLRTDGGPPKGLRDRLGSHASGRRSGDQFCVYVADALVLPRLRREEIEEIASGDLAFDALIRDFVRRNLGFRFVETSSGTDAEELERLVLSEGLSGVSPLLNSTG